MSGGRALVEMRLRPEGGTLPPVYQMLITEGDAYPGATLTTGDGRTAIIEKLVFVGDEGRVAMPIALKGSRPVFELSPSLDIAEGETVRFSV